MACIGGSTHPETILLVCSVASGPEQEWVAVLDNDDKAWDQNIFNDLFRRGVEWTTEREDRLFL